VMDEECEKEVTFRAQTLSQGDQMSLPKKSPKSNFVQINIIFSEGVVWRPKIGVTKVLKNTFAGLMPLFLFFNTQTMHIKSIVHNSIAMTSKKPYTLRDSNQGLLFLRRMRRRLHHAVRAGHFSV
jgi:hypothetical protein